MLDLALQMRPEVANISGGRTIRFSADEHFTPNSILPTVLRNLKRLGAITSQLRASQGATLASISSLTGISKSSLSEWENGLHLPATPKLVEILFALRATENQRLLTAYYLDTPLAWYALKLNPSQLPKSFIGELIKELRLRHCWSQLDLATRLSVMPSTVSSWESGSKHPSKDSLDRLFEVLDPAIGTSLTELFQSSTVLEVAETLVRVKNVVDVEALLPKLNEADEAQDIWISLCIFHAVRSRWLLDSGWTEVMIICAERYAQLLMSSNRSLELLEFTGELLFGLDSPARKLAQFESIYIMNGIAKLRLHSTGRTLRMKDIDEFDRQSTVFRHHYNWARLALGGMMTCVNRFELATQTVLRDSAIQKVIKEGGPGPEIHLIASLLCSVDKADAAKDLLDSNQKAYNGWADYKAPYMIMYDVTTARAERLLGNHRSAKSLLTSASMKLQKTDRSWRPGSYAHLQYHIESEFSKFQEI